MYKRFWHFSYTIVIKYNITFVLSSSLLPAFIGKGLITTTDSSATLHYVDYYLESLLDKYLPIPLDNTGLPQLITRLPVSDAILKHVIGLISIGHSHFLQGYPPIYAVSGSIISMYHSLPIASFRPYRCQ